MPIPPKMSSEKRILMAFAQLLEEKPLDHISIKDIYEAAGVSRSTFYNYFSTKKSLPDTALHLAFDNLTKILNADLLFRRPILAEMLDYLKENREIYYSLAVNYPEIDTITNEYITNMIVNSKIESLEQQLEEGYSIPSKYALEVYVMTIKGIIFTWIRSDFKETPEKVADMIHEAVHI